MLLRDMGSEIAQVRFLGLVIEFLASLDRSLDCRHAVSGLGQIKRLIHEHGPKPYLLHPACLHLNVQRGSPDLPVAVGE
jgi:hypothetical protein